MPNDKLATVAAPTTMTVVKYNTERGEIVLGIPDVRRYFCNKATDNEAAMFMIFCQRHGLDPFLREAYLIKYADSEPAQIAVGRDAHARRAEEHPQYAGDAGGVIVLKKDGNLIQREGEFYLPEHEALVGAWAKVWRKDRKEPIVHTIRFAEWDKARSFWKSSPAHMIVKVAKAQCRHEAFPKAFSGMYSEDEIEASRGIFTREVEAPKVLSVEEAAALPAAVVESAPLSEELAPMTEADIQAAIAAEQGAAPVEAPPAEPPLTHAEKTNVLSALVRRARNEKPPTSYLLMLKQLTGKAQYPDLTDAEIRALGKRLGAM